MWNHNLFVFIFQKEILFLFQYCQPIVNLYFILEKKLIVIRSGYFVLKYFSLRKSFSKTENQWTENHFLKFFHDAL